MPSTKTVHDPLESPSGLLSAKSHTMGIAWRPKSCRGHCATGSHRQNEFPKSACLSNANASNVAIASASSGSVFAIMRMATLTVMMCRVRTPAVSRLSVIHAKVRQQYAEGMICVDYRIHEPIVGWEWVADNWSVDAKEQTGHWEESGGTYNIQYRGFVSKDGVVTLNVDNWFDPSGYFLHEGSHARFLRHHVTAAVEKGQGDEAPSENKDHHDPAQRRCAMSYRIAEDDVTSPTEYPLCGGCILRLRGWRIPPDAGLVKIY